MAKILTLLRKFPSFSSTKLIFRCKCENVVENYTTENGRNFEKEFKPEKECKPAKECSAEKECNVEKMCSAVPVQNTSATSSSCDPVLDYKSFEAAGSASAATDVLWHQCHQCQGTPSTASVPQGEPTKRNNPPEVPTNCCMAGCPNCVWLQFAEDMMEYSINGGAHARKLIEEIEDQNLKTFLLLELNSLQKR